MATAVNLFPQGTIKFSPEGFVVREYLKGIGVVKSVFRSVIRPAEGEHTVFLLTKRDVSSQAALKIVARQLDVPRSAISHHGLKDKVAVTAQVIAVQGSYLPSFMHESIWLYQSGAIDQPLRAGKLGHHGGNKFEIVVQAEARPLVESNTFTNFFGPQRFGDGQVEVGRFLLEGDFEAASEVLLNSRTARSSLRRIMKTNHLKPAAAVCCPSFREEASFRILQWQSHLWNQLAKSCIEETLPMWAPKHSELYADLWQPEEVSEQTVQWIHAFNRKVTVTADRHSIVPVSGGYRHTFRLPPGSYATVFLGNLYNLTDASR